MLTQKFFDKDPQQVAKSLLGKVLQAKVGKMWLSAQIIETEAYYLHDKGSHSYLGFTEKRKALFMDAGTIYMYYARGQDSLNVSCHGAGNAVLIKSAYPYVFGACNDEQRWQLGSKMLKKMQQLNPHKNSTDPRSIQQLCNGQTLLCKSLGLKVIHWNQRQFDPDQFYIFDAGNTVEKIVQTTRLGISVGRDEHLPYRFVDHAFAKYCTSNPVTLKTAKDKYFLIRVNNASK